MQCPLCHSENTQRLRVVYESSLPETAMFQKAAPPSEAEYVPAVFIIILGLLFFYGGWLFILIGLILIMLGALSLYDAILFDRKLLPILREEWENAWACHKCGHIYQNHPEANRSLLEP